MTNDYEAYKIQSTNVKQLVKAAKEQSWAEFGEKNEKRSQKKL